MALNVPEKSRRRVLALTASLLCHALIGIILTVSPKAEKTNEIRPIRILAVTRSAPPTPPSKQPSEELSPKKTTTVHRGTRKAQREAKSPPSGRTYSELLPGGTWQPSTDDTGYYAAKHAGEGRSVLTSTGVLPSAEMFLGELQIPFVYRRKSPSMRAVAVIDLQDSGHSPVLDSLDGDPTLRAVLYEALIKERGRRFLQDWARRMNRTSIVIALQMKTTTLRENRRDIGEDVQWNGEVLTITRSFAEPPGGPNEPGMPLPDKEQIRGDRRDRRELEKLRSSPAYHSPIRNKIL